MYSGGSLLTPCLAPALLTLFFVVLLTPPEEYYDNIFK